MSPLRPRKLESVPFAVPSLASSLSTHDVAESRLLTNAPWLVKLRWVAVVGQLATILIVSLVLRIELPLVPLAVAVATTAVTNVMLAWWLRPRAQNGGDESPWRCPPAVVVAVVVLLDLVVLTAMLYVTGGATNPFIVFYFVNLALAGVLLEPVLAWFLNAVAIATITILYWHHWRLPVLEDPLRLVPLREAPQLALAAIGDVVAFIACSTVIVAFMTRMAGELQRSELARQQADKRRARSEKLEALGTLAAGAAHELATPLSTIAVVATEVERELAGRVIPPEVAADLRLIRSELDRCRHILDRMAFDSGAMIGETTATLTLGEVVDHVVGELANPDRVARHDEARAGERLLEVPRIALTQALRGLVQNALDAASDSQVAIKLEAGNHHVTLRIVDRGEGMAPEVLARAGDPFFTTKEPGRGMGLGLFLARSVIERLEGNMEISSEPGRGTEVVVTLPALPTAEARNV